MAINSNEETNATTAEEVNIAIERALRPVLAALDRLTLENQAIRTTLNQLVVNDNVNQARIARVSVLFSPPVDAPVDLLPLFQMINYNNLKYDESLLAWLPVPAESGAPLPVRC